MSCAAIKIVKVQPRGRNFLAECEDHRASHSSRERAVRIAAASAWSSFFGEDIAPEQINLAGVSCLGLSCTYEARCFAPGPLVKSAPKPLAKRSVKPAPTAKQIEHAFAACRAMKFAASDSRRQPRGDWDLNNLLTVERLALVALGEKEDAS